MLLLQEVNPTRATKLFYRTMDRIDFISVLSGQICVVDIIMIKNVFLDFYIFVNKWE